MRILLRLLLTLLIVCMAMPVSASPATTPQRATLRVLFVGNSLTYVNNLPRLLHALAASQPDGPRIVTTTYVAPGGSLEQRWQDGRAADALREGHWDAIVLQERGGMLACMADGEQRRQRDCRASELAHKNFAKLARAGDVRVLLLATWGPDDAWQARLDRAHDMLRSNLRNASTAVEIVPAAEVLRAYASRQSKAQVFPDGIHPGVPASLIMAAQLYRAVSGRPAQAHDVVIDFPLLQANALIDPQVPLESQGRLMSGSKTLLLKGAAIAPLLQVAYAPR